jgi:hypothetical protein
MSQSAGGLEELIELLKREIAFRDRMLEELNNIRSDVKLLLASSGRMKDAEAEVEAETDADADEAERHDS